MLHPFLIALPLLSAQEGTIPGLEPCEPAQKFPTFSRALDAAVWQDVNQTAVFQGTDPAVHVDPATGLLYLYYTGTATYPANCQPNCGAAIYRVPALGDSGLVFPKPSGLTPFLNPGNGNDAFFCTGPAPPTGMPPAIPSWDESHVETASVVTTSAGLELYFSAWAAQGLCTTGTSPAPIRQWNIGLHQPGIASTGNPLINTLPGDWDYPCNGGLWGQPGVTTRCKGGPGEPSVLVEPDGSMKMWYAAETSSQLVIGAHPTEVHIGMATKAAGSNTWVKANQRLPVFKPQTVLGTPSPLDWERRAVGQVNVIADPNCGYHMFYYGNNAAGGPGAKIGHAWSRDGITWQRNPNNPIFCPLICYDSTPNTCPPDSGVVGCFGCEPLDLQTMGPSADRVGGPAAMFLPGSNQIALYYMSSCGRFGGNAVIRRVLSQ